MCVSPGAVLLYRRPGDDKWITKYVGNMCRDEAVREGFDIDVLTAKAHGLEAKWSTVPCGQCHECRLQRSRVWANRCMLEMADYPPDNGVCRNWFLTLTYADGYTDDLRSPVDGMTLTLHNPNAERNALVSNIRYMQAYNDLVEAENTAFDGLGGSSRGGLSIPDVVLPKPKRDHLAQFNHDLLQYWQRKYNHVGIRFFACGEYGDLKMRPHYHGVYFNLPIDYSDLKPLFKNKFGDQFYNVDTLSEIWGKGFVVVSEASWTNCAYTARYIMKKQTGENAEVAYHDLGILPPFVRMSRKPGIGFSAFKSYDSYCDIDEVTGEIRFKKKIVLPNATEHVDPLCNHPRYFDKLMEAQDPAFMEVVKEWRSKMSDIAYKAQKKVLPMSDRELFSFRKEAYDKHPIGLFRASVE